MSDLFPHYRLVPKGEEEQEAWRDRCWELGCKSDLDARRLWGMCAEDFLFYLNTFVRTCDPNAEDAWRASRPFNTFGYVDSASEQLVGNFGKKNICIVKSRQLMATWLLVALFDWQWKFHPNRALLMCSRKMEYVDFRGSLRALFQRLDYIEDGRNMAPFMRVKMSRRRGNLMNVENGSFIDGEATVSNIGRGGTYTAILLDEFAAFRPGDDMAVYAATQAASRCCIFNSTPMGNTNAFYAVAHNTGVVQIRFSWKDHPERGGGRYQDEKGAWRSPWYDEYARTALSDWQLAQEQDLSFTAAGSPFVARDDLEPLVARTTEPGYEGSIVCGDDGVPEGWLDQKGGLIKVWDAGVKPAAGMRYVIGCDISTGMSGLGNKASEASNSVFSVIEASSGRKVAEGVSGEHTPEQFAKLCVAAAWWWNEAKLGWEANGPGQVFGRTVWALGYRHIYYRENSANWTKKTGKLSMASLTGWYSSPEKKRAVLDEYRKAVLEGDIKNPSRLAMLELGMYVYASGGKVEYQGSNVGSEYGILGQNHGDRVIADAIAWMLAMEERGSLVQQRAEKGLGRGTPWRREIPDLDKAPVGSVGYFLKRRQDERRKAGLY